jgi:hypothetical protein
MIYQLISHVRCMICLCMGGRKVVRRGSGGGGVGLGGGNGRGM